MNPRVTAVWTIAVALAAVLGGLALQHPAAHRPPSLSSGPLFAAPSFPAHPVDTAVAVPVSITLTDRGCRLSRSDMPSGPATFTVINPGHTTASEAELTTTDGSRILAEAEDVDAGRTAVFSYRLDAGSYAIDCPVPGVRPVLFTVTGHA